jgi:hypothetical protein
MSKSRNFGQQVEIFVSADGQAETKLAEVDNFSFKMDDVVKENSSLGEAGIGSISILSNGGTCSFEAKQSDSKLLAFFHEQQQQTRGGGTDGKRGEAPYLEVRMKITQLDQSVTTVAFEGLKLHSFDVSVAGRTEEIVEKWEGKFKRSTLITNGGDSTISATLATAFIQTALSNLNVLSASTTTNPENGTYDYTSFIAAAIEDLNRTN